MSLKHALLGLLRYHPATGYDLNANLVLAMQHFWAADQSQIYRTLKQLAAAGWAEIEVVRQTERPNRKLYHITDAGRAELGRWLKSPVPVERPHDPLMLMIFFAGLISDEEALSIFQEAKVRAEKDLVEYDRAPKVVAQDHREIDAEREAFFWDLALELARAVAEAQVAWATSVIERLEQGEVPTAGSGSSIGNAKRRA